MCITCLPHFPSLARTMVVGVAVALTTSAGCGRRALEPVENVNQVQPAEQTIVGRWVLDHTKQRAKDSFGPGTTRELSEPFKQEAKPVTENPDDPWYELGSGGVFAKGSKGSTTKGTWQLLKTDGTRVYLELADERDTTDLVLEVIDKDHIAVRFSPEMSGFGPAETDFKRADPVRVATGTANLVRPAIPERDRQAVAALLKIKGCIAKTEKRGERTVLKVYFPNVSDASDAAMAEMHQPLKVVSLPIDLDLQDCKALSGAGLAALAGVPGLWSVNLAGINVGDAGIAHLKDASNLNNLIIKPPVSPNSKTNEINVTDAGLASLAGLVRLEGLFLFSDEVTDAGLVHLGKLTRLRTLWIYARPLSKKAKKVTEAGYVHLKGLTNLEQVHVGSELGDAGLENMKGMTKLRDLSVGGFDIRLTDGGMALLKSFPELRTLRVHGPKLTAAGLAPLADLKQLEEVVILGCPAVSGEGLAPLQSLKNLQVLEVSGYGPAPGKPTPNTSYLAKLANLRRLYLNNLDLDDDSLKYLEGLVDLRILNLSGTEVTDQGLAHLKPLKALRNLYISGTAITDDGLAQLKDLKNLAFVSCTNTRVTARGAALLRQDLPAVNVDWR
jgi:hypothetical protein